MSKDKVADLMKDIKELSVMDLVNLVKAIEEEFGVSAQAPVAVAAAAPAAGGEEAAAEKTSFNVILKAAGDSKTGAIKFVRDLLGVSIIDAKKLVDGAPAVLLEGVDKAKAEEVANQLKEIGAEVSVE